MKILSTSVSSGKTDIFTPVQTLLIGITKSDSAIANDAFSVSENPSVIKVSLQNSKTGEKNDIVPHIKLPYLAEIATYNEGQILFTDNYILFPVMLNPVGNVDLDNDKFLRVEFETNGKAVDIFAFSEGTMSNFISKYDKMNVPAGTSRLSFNTKGIELMYLPNFQQSFDSVRLTYSNGLSSELTSRELQYLMSKNNDITAFKTEPNSGIIETGTSNLSGSFANGAIINLNNVSQVEIIRDTVGSSSNYEFIFGNFK